MTEVFFDPPRCDAAWPGKIYNGDIIILSPTPEMLALVEHTRGMIEEAFAPRDLQRAHESLGGRTVRRNPFGTETELYPLPPNKKADTARLERLWLLFRKDVPRRAASSLRLPQRLSYDWYSLRPPSAPRHLAFGADVPIQLVGAHLRVRLA